MPKTKQKQQANNHLFRGCRDAVTTPQAGTTPPTQAILITSDANGVAGFGVVLAPLGLTSAVLASGAYTNGTIGNVLAPNLRGLFAKAIDFQWYRVTRARLVAVCVTGANTVGSIVLSGYSDPMDIQTVTLTSNVAGPNNKSFPLAAAVGRELSVPIPVDGSWKKVSSIMTVPGNVYPFNAAAATSVASVATVADLSFGAIYVRVVGAPANTPVASFYIDYDVEFKGPIDSSVNA